MFQEGRAIDSSPFKMSIANHQKNMKISPHQKTTSIFCLTILGIFTASNSCLAWDGIDPKKNSSVEIEAGNLVREGAIIDFYDSADGNYHTGKVVLMNASSNATELTVEDFTENHKERFFLMNE